MKIQVEHRPCADRIEQLGVAHWPTWGAEVSCFPWTYGETETCYLVAGEVVVTPDGGQAVILQAGDLATFPAGMSCTWDIRQAIRKHYRFG